jgi:hypothetical protein
MIYAESNSTRGNIGKQAGGIGEDLLNTREVASTRFLRENGLETSNTSSRHLYLVIDNPERLKRVGERHLGRTMHYIQLTSL